MSLWSMRGAVILVAVASLGCSKETAAPAARPSAASSAGGTSSKAAPVTADASAAKATSPGKTDAPASPPGVPFWPRFHGPKGDNLSTETGLLKQWPKDGPTLAWTAKGLGHGFSSVAVAGGLIYTAGNKDEKTMVSALDLDGKPQWQVEDGPAWTREHPGTRGTPTIDGDRLYYESPLGELICCKAKAGYASPVLAECQGLRIVLTMDANALLGVHADTGDLLFTFPHKTSYDVNATSPVYHDGHVFITSGYGSGCSLLKLKVEGQKASVEEVWKSKALDNHHGGVILLDGFLYGASHNGPWVCLEWKTGTKKYSERGVGKGSLTYADGMLYTLSEKQAMGLVEATPDGHKVVSQFTVPSGGEGPSWAHPVVCGGRLYVRHSDQLFAYDVRAGKN